MIVPVFRRFVTLLTCSVGRLGLFIAGAKDINSLPHLVVLSAR